MHLQKLIKTIFQARYVPEDFYKAILRLYQDMHLTTTILLKAVFIRQLFHDQTVLSIGNLIMRKLAKNLLTS